MRDPAGVRRRTVRSRLLLVAVVTLVSTLLGSCLVVPFLPDENDTPTPVPTAPGTPPPDRPQLARFYGQKLTWSGCLSGAECAKLTVPVDYARPDGETLELAVLRVKARSASQRLGSIVVNPGGPGGSGIEYAASADVIVGADLRRRFDIVGFDPRGVGKSRPVDCLDDPGMDGFLAADPTPDTAAEEQALIDVGRSFVAGCRAKSPTMLPHVSTIEAAQDMDVLREVLGDAKLNFLGKSYGSYLGTVYAEQFPATVGRFVLDGIVPPDLTSQQLSEGQARGFELATRAYLQDCIDRGSCPAGDTVEEGLQWLRDLFTQLDAQPLPVTGDPRITQLTEGWGSLGVGVALYEESLWPELTGALEAAKAGDGTKLMRLANRYADRGPGGRYTGNLLEVIYAVNCSDRPDTADIPTIKANAASYAAKAPTWGRFMAWGSAICGIWPVQPTKGPRVITAQGSGPIVVVGTTRDPATIYEWAPQLRNQLANGVLITYDGDGHTAYQRSNACVDKPIDEYFVNGTTPRDGLRC